MTRTGHARRDVWASGGRARPVLAGIKTRISLFLATRGPIPKWLGAKSILRTWAFKRQFLTKFCRPVLGATKGQVYKLT